MFFNWIGPLAYFAYGRKDSPFCSCCRKNEQPAVIEETRSPRRRRIWRPAAF